MLRRLALLLLSVALLLRETYIGVIGFGFFMLPLILVAFVTTPLGVTVQLRLALWHERESAEG